MEKTTKTLVRIIFIIILVIFFSGSVLASEIINIQNEYDSMYKYNAMENKISFIKTTSNPNTTETKLSNDAAKELQDFIGKQNISTNIINSEINSINDRSEIDTFLSGNNLGILKFQAVQTKGQILMLNILFLKTEDSQLKIQIENQIEILKQSQIKVENLIIEQENKFSLFGWLRNIL